MLSLAKLKTPHCCGVSSDARRIGYCCAARRQESDLGHAGVLCIGHDRRDLLILGGLVGLNLQFRLRILLRGHAQLRLQAGFGDRLVVPEQLAGGRTDKRDRLRRMSSAAADCASAAADRS